jgi:hypothetical protein
MEEQFIEYCRNGDMVNLVNYYVDIKFSQKYFDTGFEAACSSGHMNIVHFLYINKNSDTVINFDSAFSCASYYGHFNVVKYIYDKRVIDITKHVTLFSLAIKSKKLEFIKWVMSIIKVDLKEYVNDVCYNGKLEILEYFYNLDPFLFENEKIKKEALQNAELMNNTEIINWLKEH